jgi:hypothetical protein
VSAQFGEVIRDRIGSVLASAPFRFTPAAEPFTFARQPIGNVDQVSRVEWESGGDSGSLNFLETRVDRAVVYVARLAGGDPDATYQQLLTDVASIGAAVIRDGATGGGDYAVPNGRSYRIDRDPGAAYQVLRLTIPVDYETTV